MLEIIEIIYSIILMPILIGAGVLVYYLIDDVRRNRK